MVAPLQPMLKILAKRIDTNGKGVALEVDGVPFYLNEGDAIVFRSTIEKRI